METLELGVGFVASIGFAFFILWLFMRALFWAFDFYKDYSFVPFRTMKPFLVRRKFYLFGLFSFAVIYVFFLRSQLISEIEILRQMGNLFIGVELIILSLIHQIAFHSFLKKDVAAILTQMSDKRVRFYARYGFLMEVVFTMIIWLAVLTFTVFLQDSMYHQYLIQKFFYNTQSSYLSLLPFIIALLGSLAARWGLVSYRMWVSEFNRRQKIT
ncbi:MAG TPA: hypothetical protein VJB70_01475 [Candidatus Paceibacterota bacterium]